MLQGPAAHGGAYVIFCIALSCAVDILTPAKTLVTRLHTVYTLRLHLQHKIKKSQLMISQHL